MVPWKYLLKLAGGHLALQKCFYYILCWQFDEVDTPHPVSLEEERAICNQEAIHDSDLLGSDHHNRTKGREGIKHDLEMP
jgi:hypothetical protein